MSCQCARGSPRHCQEHSSLKTAFGQGRPNIWAFQARHMSRGMITSGVIGNCCHAFQPLMARTQSWLSVTYPFDHKLTRTIRTCSTTCIALSCKPDTTQTQIIESDLLWRLNGFTKPDTLMNKQQCTWRCFWYLGSVCGPVNIMWRQHMPNLAVWTGRTRTHKCNTYMTWNADKTQTCGGHQNALSAHSALGSKTA